MKMKKRMLLAILCVSILIAGSITAYVYFEDWEHPDYSSGMFVDGSGLNEHATMYDLYTTL